MILFNLYLILFAQLLHIVKQFADYLLISSFFNPDIKLPGLPCSASRTLFVREDLSDLEAVAKKFEQEESVILEVQRQSRKGDDMDLLFQMFPRAEDDGYTTYCKIKSELYTGISESNDQLQESASSPQVKTLVDPLKVTFLYCILDLEE